jgi:hypothetical protein
MSDDRSAPDRDISPFEQLVMMLATSSMHQLGKLVNPQTGRAEVDLAGAGWTIDLLGMLEEKTQGNLDRREAQTLGEALSTLRLNFVEAMSAAPGEKPASDAPQAPAPAATKVEPAPGGKGDEGDAPKFHKSYG